LADAFTRNRLNWIEQVAIDSTLKGDAVRLGVILATRFLNRRTGECWPAIATLAELLVIDESTVRRATASLIGAGYLTRKRGGKGRPNRYAITFHDRAKMPDQEESSPRKNARSSDVMSAQFCTDDRAKLLDMTVQNCPPNPLNEPYDEPVEESISRNSASSPKRKSRKVDEEAFENFWKQYPRKVAKGAARKAFPKALEKASAQDLELGAMRYAAEREGQDPKYTKHAATWLSKECWLDEPTPEHKNPLSAAFDELGDRIRRRSLSDIAIDGGEL